MSILEELYHGRICPADKYIKRGSRYQELAHMALEKEEKLFESLERNERVLYEEINEICLAQEEISERETFVEGFRIGAQTMLEVLTEPDTQLYHI